MIISRRALLLAVAGALLLAGSAYAHADYLRSAPGENSVVSAPPERVDIWFTQELFRRQGENRIEVFDPGGQPMHAGEAQVDNDDRAHLWVALLPELAPGTYRVMWYSLSAEDGDNDEGEFSFTFDPQAEVTSTPMGVETSGVPAEGPGGDQATPPPSQPPDENQPPAALPADTTTQTPTPPAAQSEPGAQSNRCLGGAVPVAGLVAVAWALRRRKPIAS